MTQQICDPDGRRLSVESVGDPEGKPVFLLHGTPGSRNGPRPRGIVLYRLGIRLISYDRPGYPGSDRNPGRKVASAAENVRIVADYFGIDRFSVVGRSGGAPHALACAALMPDRVVSAAALCSPAPFDAEDLNWTVGMTESNVRAYGYANTGQYDALIICSLCREQGVPSATVRIILDTADTNLPLDFNQYLTADQQVDIPKLTRAVLFSPSKVRALLHLQQQGKAAAQKLGEVLAGLLAKVEGQG